MRKANERLLRALAFIENQCPDDYLVVRQWFLESAGDHDNVLRSAESATLVYRSQGASKELLEVCEILAEPRELAGKVAQVKAGIRSAM